MPVNFKLGHRPTLDGLRGVAVLMVMLSHTDLTWLSTSGGFVGVHVFFVLSGFLITSLLLEEHGKTGTIRIGAFYARRALRLLPAIAVLMIAALVVAWASGSSSELKDVGTSVVMMLTYSTNWFRISGQFPSESLGHAWTLAVEEHFYIAWPLVLLGLLRILGRRRIMAVVAAAIVGVAAWRIYLLLSTSDLNRIYFGSDTNADALLVGVVVALAASLGLVPNGRPALRILHAAGAALVLLLPVALLTLVRYGRVCWWLDVGGLLAIELGVGILIVALLATPLRTLFESRPLVWTGRVSYGLYLWHVPMGFWVQRYVGSGPWACVAWIVATFSVTALSFYAIERPILGFKDRFVPVLAVQEKLA